MVKLDSCGDCPGSAKSGLALAKPEDRVCFPEGWQVHLGDGGDECLGTFRDFCVGGGGAALSVNLLLCL
jgi:hypothetical protein